MPKAAPKRRRAYEHRRRVPCDHYDADNLMDLSVDRDDAESLRRHVSIRELTQWLVFATQTFTKRTGVLSARPAYNSFASRVGTG